MHDSMYIYHRMKITYIYYYLQSLLELKDTPPIDKIPVKALIGDI